MRLKSLFLKNFQSYQELDLDLSDIGLCLISGDSGSGKSGILDGVLWTLYGTTSKESNADDIKSWFSESRPTTGYMTIETPTGILEVVRTRGENNKNDLFYTETSNPEIKIRGKNLVETQKLLDTRLGIGVDLFIIGSYLHQFSKSDSFFTMKAKERREVLESICDLSTAILLEEKSSDKRKAVKKEVSEVEMSTAKKEGQLHELSRSLESLSKSSAKWKEDQEEKLHLLLQKRDAFDYDKDNEIHNIISKLEELHKLIIPKADFNLKDTNHTKQSDHLTTYKKIADVKYKQWIEYKSLSSQALKEINELKKLPEDQCPYCLGETKNPNFLNKLNNLHSEYEINSSKMDDLSEEVEKDSELIRTLENNLHSAVKKYQVDCMANDKLISTFEELQAKVQLLRSAKNHYQEQIDELAAQVNPIEESIANTDSLISSLRQELQDSDIRLNDLLHLSISLNWLYDKSFDLRGALMERAVKELSDSTNTYLDKYFDAQIRVRMTIEDSDKVEVEILNGGYSCPFKQLSGGERRMLSLAFNVSVMKAAQNKSGVHLSTLMFDEAFSGIDNSLKTKAFSLLQSLEKDAETIFVIDHSEEMKSLFDTKYEVEKHGDVSTIQQVMHDG